MPNENIKLKNTAIVVFLVFLVLVIFYSLFFGPGKKFADSLWPVKTISVSAEGKVTVSPDIAKISFSVVSEGIDPEKIANENNRKMNEAINYIKSQGVDEKDIKTTQYNLSPRYEYDEKSRKTFVSGYTLTQTVLVKVRDLSKVGKILGGLPELGINQIGSISFEVDDPEKYLAEARKQAFDKAKLKAEEMAATNNVKLGEVITFSEYQGGQPGPYMETLGKGGGGAAQVAPSIQPGTQEVTIQVNITYEIK